MASSPSLSDPQLKALLNILTHAETYNEIQAFKNPEATSRHGYPFTSPTVNGDCNDPGGKYRGEGSDAPLLQLLLVKLVLGLPGIRHLHPEFWSLRVQGLLTKLAEADLSESYDKGAIGTRKTLATASSSIIEALARGFLGGCPRRMEPSPANDNGERSLDEAWDEFVEGLIHGDLIDELCDWLSETDDVEALSPLVQEAAEYAIIYLASFLHHVFVVSSEGQYLLKLIENTHKLIPYSMLRQVFKLGNAATMLNAMVKLLLAKLSLTSLSNWVGLTQNADEGMNLLQRIISGVLSWDSSNFTQTTGTIEKSKTGPSPDHLLALRQHVQETTRTRHVEIRQTSIAKTESIVVTILETTSSSSSLSQDQHLLCHQYHSSLLSARDRTEITSILCRQTPDLLAQAVREGVAAFEPMIRDIHEKIGLAEHLSAGQAYVDDFIKTSSPKKVEIEEGKGGQHQYQVPSVEDFVHLLQRHRGAVYRYAFHICSRCPDIRDSYRAWARQAVRAFNHTAPVPVAGSAEPPATTEEDPEFLSQLNALFTSLPAPTREKLVPILSAHASYLDTIHIHSLQRLRAISSPYSSSTPVGPGIYLSSWQALLDETAITPDATAPSTLRRGKDVINRTTPGKTGAHGEIVLDGTIDAREGMEEMERGMVGPDVGLVVEALGDGFRRLLRDVAATAVDGLASSEGVSCMADGDAGAA